MKKLEIQNLEKTFNEGDVVAVDGISFNVNEGEITALLGPSGCGKTTTLRSIAGVERIDKGTITIDGVEVSSGSNHIAPENRHLGMVYQNYAIWPHKTVYENVVFPLRFRKGIEEQDYEGKVMDILETIHIEKLSDKPATDLSGGQQQRVALARAVVHDPSLVLLDEPLSNLDAKLRTEMRNEIQRLQVELGLTMIYVTHDQEEAFYLADNVLVMNEGKVEEKGDPRTLYNNPQNPFTREFVGRWNKFPGQLRNDVIDLGFVEYDLNQKIVNWDDSLERLKNTPVACFIRPSNIKINENGQEGEDGINLNGTVVAAGVIGELFEVTAELEKDKRKITAQLTEYPNVDRGEEIKISFNTNDIQVYKSGEQ